MKISKIHRMLSYRLEERKALTNPEDFLGPNWQDVINFWLFIDTLSKDEELKIGDRYPYTLDVFVRDHASSAASNMAIEVVGRNVSEAAWSAAFCATRLIFADATDELLAHHKLLEQGKTVVALPLCLNS